MKLDIINLVGLMEYEKRLNLERIAIAWDETFYNPERFPGLQYKPQAIKPCGYNIFTSGKIVIYGARSVLELKAVAARLEEMLDKNPEVHLNAKNGRIKSTPTF